MCFTGRETSDVMGDEMAETGIPGEWLSAIRFWAVDEPLIQSIAVGPRGPSEATDATRPLKLVLATAADAYGNTLSAFIQGRAGWAVALEERLKVRIDLLHHDPALAINRETEAKAVTVWPR